MKKIKSIIITLVILIFVTLIAIIILNTIKKSKINVNGDVGDEPEVTGNTEEVTDTTTLITVEDCIQQYYNIINNNSSLYYARGEDGYKKIITDEEINKNIIDLLSNEYVTKNNINTNNLDRYLKKTDEDVDVISLKMKVLINDPIQKYAVYGKIVNLEYKLIDEFYLYVNLDTVNKTFSIEPINSNNFDKVEITNNNTSIESNNNNVYEYANLGYEEIIEESMNRFKILAFADTDTSYNYLDEEYRNKRFASINKYKEYIKLNKNCIEESTIEKYKVNYYDDYIQYICIDQYGNYYIFEEKGVMNYKLKLDTYTIQTEEFKDKYNNGSDQLKVGMNLEKVFQALNRKDYEYIYNKLDNTFKTNNFATLSDFENYIKNMSFDINKIEYGVFEERSGVYVYNVKLLDAQEKNENIIEKNFIMKLEEDTDFTMAFNIN